MAFAQKSRIESTNRSDRAAASNAIRALKARLFLLSFFTLVAVIGRPADPASALSGAFSVMPSAYVGGGNVTHGGLHFDDGSRAAYDFSHSDDAWLRGTVTTTLNNVKRYQYWNEGSCRMRARLQLYDPWTAQWYDDYSADVDILHLNSMPSGTNYSQNFQLTYDWFYKVLGTASTCGTYAAHSHLAMTLSSIVSKTSKSNDTCWANGTECNVMGGASVRVHANNLPPPDGDGALCKGRWAGGYATNLSGGVLDPYQCQEWSYTTMSDQAAVFTVVYP